MPLRNVRYAAEHGEEPGYPHGQGRGRALLFWG
jgi:hypothetical protein